MDFYRILEVETKDRNTKRDIIEIVPDFQVCRSKDLLIRGKKFYAIWDAEASLWSTDEYDVQRIVDRELIAHANKVKEKRGSDNVRVKTLGNYSTGLWTKFVNYTANLSDNYTQLDERITFANDTTKKEDYASRRCSYALSEGGIDAYTEIFGTLYEPDELRKLEWAVGAILVGDARYIQKFIVLYGPPGGGKGTFLKLVEFLFDGYIATFEAQALTSSSNAFSTEVFRNNPLVAINHDGDLSRIADNSKLNSIVSHEDMVMNEKFKSSYTAKIIAFLFMGSNKAVKITDAKSGLIRRLIDVQPSGRKIPERRYHMLMFQLQMELGAIAYHCIEVYREMGREYYSSYQPVEMMLQTDVFFNYIDHFYEVFLEQDGVSLRHAYMMYKDYCNEAQVEYKLPQYRFREELKNYFREYHDRYIVDGERLRSYYRGFVTDHFKIAEPEEKPMALLLDHTESLLDEVLANEPAQYSKADGTPTKFWSDKERMIRGELQKPKPDQVCSTILSDLDTTKEHYVKPPLNHIVIDFDLKDEEGNKSQELNLEAASKWPITYAEFSKGGSGIHLHYKYDGDAEALSRIFDEDIEIKVFVGDSSLRRRLSYCNDVPIATISSGLPLKEKKMLSGETIQSERGLRAQVAKNLRKEVHPATKPSMDFIKHILDQAYESGLEYDLSDMYQALVTFAMNSSHQSQYCLRLLSQLKLQGKKADEPAVVEALPDKDRVVILDTEVFPNLFIVCWKYRGDNHVTRMINPSPEAVEALVRLPFVGFNNRRYDNHILYAWIMGYNNHQLYEKSKQLVDGNINAGFGEAYGLSYADIYDFAATKQGLKQWQLDLGLTHKENEYPWDEPVPEHKWEEVADYCENDVRSTEAVFEHLQSDFNARQMMAELSGLAVNEPLRKHAAKIILRGDRDAQKSFVYTDLSEMFPGYTFDFNKSFYGGDEEEIGEGGLVRSKPGMYENVAVLDVESMHPTSIVELNLFGPYTKNFEDILKARLAIKHGDYDTAKKMFNGALTPYLGSEEDAEKLSYALKIIINSIYGFTAASFDNPFRDARNKDNIVAKRGALFMVDLMKFVESEGFEVIHTKTDSIKIPNATEEIIRKVIEFGKKYGYNFEHEATYSKFCLVNKAVYIAHVGWAKKKKKIGTWEAVGKQFQHPYVYKKLFSRETMEHSDLIEAKNVKTRMYLDFTPETDTPMALVPDEVEDKHLRFVGKAGAFVPVKIGGGYLLREKDGKLHAVSETTGYKWREASVVANTKSWDDVDYRYFHNLADKAIDAINEYGDFEMFVGDSFADDRVSEPMEVAA